MRIDLESLVVSAAEGDATAFAELVNETSPLVSSIALAIVRDLDLSRDVAQEVFLGVWRDLRKLRNPASFLPWLRQMTRNRAHTTQRTEWRRRKLGDSALDEMLPAVTDPHPDSCQRMIAAEEIRALEEALAALPEDTREALVLFYREGQSVAQVASLLELSEAAVKQRLSRARAALRSSLQDQIGEALSRTAPAAAFTAGIMAALPLAAPSTASAAAFAASKSAAPAVGLAKLLPLLSGALAGAVGGVLGVLFGARWWYNQATDEQERRQLRVFTWVSALVVLAFALAFPVALQWTHSTWLPVGWFAAFVAALAVLQHVWLPRIVRRRMQDEMRRDPHWARARRRLERRRAILGWTLGITGGALGLSIGLWSLLK